MKKIEKVRQPADKPKKKKIEEKVEEKIKEKIEEKVLKTPEEPMSEESLFREASKSSRYSLGIGRRKTAVAQVRLFTQGEKTFVVNGKPLDKYFPTLDLQQIASSSLNKMKCLDRFGVVAKVNGGGIHAQAEAVRHGISRALVVFNQDFRKRLRRVGYLTRDPRMRERKKFGLKRARRAPQWAKR
jgi:small subunit ribosomal protein S9